MGNVVPSYINVHEAARTGHIKEVRKWVDSGKDVNVRDHTQKTPLHFAAQWGQDGLVEYLIECGASINARDYIKDTPLHFATYWGHPSCVHLLTEAGADIKARDKYGNLPCKIFDDHVSQETIAEMQRLMDDQHVLVANRTRSKSPGPRRTLGPDSSGTFDVGNLRQHEEYNPEEHFPDRSDSRHFQRSSLDGSVMEPLYFGHSHSILGGMGSVKWGEKSAWHTIRHYENEAGMVDVFRAASDGEVGVLKLALARGQDLDSPSSENDLTPLMGAAENGRYSSAKYLIDQGADIERSCPMTGYRPLHFAAFFCRASVVRLLVVSGAEVDAPDLNSGLPGDSFSCASYLRWHGLRDRRLIRRFLKGDLEIDFQKHGRSVFPMNSPLEAYDAEHQPNLMRMVSEAGSPELPGEEGSTLTGEAAEEADPTPGSIRYYLRRASVGVHGMQDRLAQVPTFMEGLREAFKLKPAEEEGALRNAVGGGGAAYDMGELGRAEEGASPLQREKPLVGSLEHKLMVAAATPRVGDSASQTQEEIVQQQQEQQEQQEQGGSAARAKDRGEPPSPLSDEQAQPSGRPPTAPSSPLAREAPSPSPSSARKPKLPPLKR